MIEWLADPGNLNNEPTRYVVCDAGPGGERRRRGRLPTCYVRAVWLEGYALPPGWVALTMPPRPPSALCSTRHACPYCWGLLPQVWQGEVSSDPVSDELAAMLGGR